jgi:hypothetical protein
MQRHLVWLNLSTEPTQLDVPGGPSNGIAEAVVPTILWTDYWFSKSFGYICIIRWTTPGLVCELHTLSRISAIRGTHHASHLSGYWLRHFNLGWLPIPSALHFK